MIVLVTMRNHFGQELEVTETKTSWGCALRIERLVPYIWCQSGSISQMTTRIIPIEKTFLLVAPEMLYPDSNIEASLISEACRSKTVISSSHWSVLFLDLVAVNPGA